ncbi:uncharacterized protein LOC124709062 [Schistocerca piceifrons]|uniref:uncharacterized protein LOC124709062 n=1 Tax=Schistocerca piceifrons TaxID=274613 RepID=UPI001F5F9DD6|nr:uncharacterized protein LOC124709062 [Schistocerca piceifrons]
MPLSTREIMDALAIVAEHENVKVAVRKSVTGGVIACLTTICGGLLGGRFGMAIGKRFSFLSMLFLTCVTTSSILMQGKGRIFGSLKKGLHDFLLLVAVTDSVILIAQCSTLGGIAAYIMSDNFKPLPQILKEDLSVQQKEELVRSVRAVINDIRVEDAVMLATLIVGNRTLSKTVLQLVVNFLRTQM